MGKRGKKPLAVKREPNGRASRKKDDAMQRVLDQVDRDVRDALMVGLEARVRVHGVLPQHSRDQMAGTFVGRLCMQGVISRLQYDAGMAWLEDREAYMLAIAAPRQPGAIDLNRVQGIPTADENVSRAKAAIARYEAAGRVVQDKQTEMRLSAHLFGALDTILVRDVAVENLVGDLRCALNALVKHYGLAGRKAA